MLWDGPFFAQGPKPISQLHWLRNGVTTSAWPILLKGTVSGSFGKGLLFLFVCLLARGLEPEIIKRLELLSPAKNHKV